MFFTFNSPFLSEKCMKWFEIFKTHVKNNVNSLLFLDINNKLIRAILRVFLTSPTKSIWKRLTYNKLSVRKFFIHVQRSFSQNLRLFGWEIRGLWNIRKKRSVAASRIGHRARAREQGWRREGMKATLVCWFSCSIPDARRGYRAFFLIKIHNSYFSS